MAVGNHYSQAQDLLRLSRPGLEDSLREVTPASFVNNNKVTGATVYPGPGLDQAFSLGFLACFPLKAFWKDGFHD